ncbi:MAG: uracil-DNA glycosylase [Bacteroidales bacterium]
MRTAEENITELKKKVRTCNLCRLSETRDQAVPPEGNPKARIMIIAQAPGREENQKGKMFLGPSGEVLNQLFAHIGLKREEVYMTNLLKCFLPNCRKPRQDEIDACNVYLDQEIDYVAPDVIVTLGYHPTKHILKKYDLKIPNRYNFPGLFGNLLVACKYKILPLRHPASVVHESANFEILEKNYHKLNIMNQTCKWYHVCPMKYFYNQGKLSKFWIDRYCKGDWKSCERYRMEENNIPHPDNMLPDGTIDYNLE